LSTPAPKDTFATLQLDFFLELAFMNNNRKKHWETIYETKSSDQVSWTQETPQTSLDFIHFLGLTTAARIIDIGGGDSKLVDILHDEGFENITVLDISATALAKTKRRLGDKAKKVNWIACDITEFHPNTTFDVWHDRATFHFLTTKEQIFPVHEYCKKSCYGLFNHRDVFRSWPSQMQRT
jgi:trans-aconitate methyltransferase